MSLFAEPLSRGQWAVRGLLAVALGCVLLVWPSITIGTVVVLFAIYAFADAIASVTRVFRSEASGGDRALSLVRAAIEITAGVVAIAYPGPTAAVMTVVLGLFAIATGVNELAGAHKLRRLGAPGTGWLVATGALSVIVGITLVVWPGIGAVTLALLFGAYLVVYGITLDIAAALPRRTERVEAAVRA
jgi:uncharacterized membrane protein HdeD (DUF308 family)